MKRAAMHPDIIQHLQSFNHGIGNPLPDATVASLKRGAQLVIAGQQPGLLLGPLYTFWKLLTAMVMARDITENEGVDTIPAFWIASEDHDIFEVNRVVIAGGKFVAAPDTEPVRGQMPPVGRVSLKQHRDGLLQFMGRHLPDTPHREWLLDIAATADFSSYGRFFATLAAALFREWSVVFVDALELHRFTGPFLAAAVEQYAAVEHGLERGSERLRQLDLDPPLKDAGIFEILSGDLPARVKCSVSATHMDTSRGRLPLNEAAAWIREEPARFSAGAALRPVLQDAVLPVACTVCGPSEILYLWQIDAVYDALKVARSTLQPRIHATVLPPQARRVIDKLGGMVSAWDRRGFDAPDIQTGDPERLAAVREDLCRALEAVSDADPKHVARAVKSIRHQVDKVSDSIMKVRRERQDSRHRQQARFDAWVMPGGVSQERIVCLPELLAEWGPEWLEWMRHGMSPWETSHRCVMMR